MMSKSETMYANDFWSELPHVPFEAEQLDDEASAAMLINFLEDHRQTWEAIVVAMRATSGKRALFERACLVLAERKVDERLSS
jgi:G:T/U-mismatch repair DNA glycosylase